MNMRQNRNYGQEHINHMRRDQLLAIILGTATVLFGAYTAVNVDPTGFILILFGLTSILTSVIIGLD